MARKQLAIGIVVLALGLVAIGGWLRSHSQPRPPKGMVYTSAGYGGYTPVEAPRPPSNDPMAPINAAYQSGHFVEAERLGQELIARTQAATDPIQRRLAVRAEWVLAYVSARQGNFKMARDRFAVLVDQARELPDHGAPPPQLGDPQPTLEEEGAFQHAVCTSALGDKGAAEAEYRQFLQRYPQSLLIHAAIKRIGSMHGGDIPKDAEALWQAAMKKQKQAAEAKDREASLCGPKCLAELLRRQGKQADVHSLADEMKTNGQGTSLLALSETATRHGLKSEGLQLPLKQLGQQKLPAIALIKPGHFVLVEAITPQKVTVWDPEGVELGKAKTQDMMLTDWEQSWNGVLLVLR